ncbi:MAG: hypothetical protein LBU53_05085 [Zoogloeaceae bacterium]|jgi:hypothetical protein|nr:hypothetical protein [Zoogloeaceae bacterium]
MGYAKPSRWGEKNKIRRATNFFIMQENEYSKGLLLRADERLRKDGELSVTEHNLIADIYQNKFGDEGFKQRERNNFDEAYEKWKEI